jgi:ribosomal protein L37AE/L43A
MVISKNSWKCSKCGYEYDNEDDAYDCQDECQSIQKEDAVEGKRIFTCEMCNKYYDRYKKAVDCENRHKDWDDLFYINYLSKIELEKLLKAANLPGQKKLI